jgi:hypothetical protein
MNVFARLLDERFFAHRLRSTSYGGIAATVLALVLFLYRHYADHVWSWDLLAVGLTMVAVKLGAMAWFYATE